MHAARWAPVGYCSSATFGIQAGVDASFDSLKDNEQFNEMVLLQKPEESNVIITDDI